MVLLVVFIEKSIDFELFSRLLIMIGLLTSIVIFFLPIKVQTNIVNKLYGKYAKGGKNKDTIVYLVTSSLMLIGVIIGFIIYIL